MTRRVCRIQHPAGRVAFALATFTLAGWFVHHITNWKGPQLMATPVVTATLNQASYEPGDALTVSWTVVDADNSTETLRLEGTDSQDNQVIVNLTVNRLDPFIMTRVYWPRTGVNLAINQAARTATGTVPTA